MDSTDLSRDVSGTRSFSQFVVELADRQASLVLPNISLLLSHLDGDVSRNKCLILFVGLINNILCLRAQSRVKMCLHVK